MKTGLKKIAAFSIMTVLIWLSGCAAQRAEIGRDNADPCSLLSSAEIQSVQGETVSLTKGDRRQNGPFVISQCFYTLPTYSRSISVDVMQAAGNAKAASEFWDRRFHSVGRDAEEKASNRSVENGSGSNREAEEEKEKARPQPVSGIGDEAFWAGTQVSGSLYILHGTDIVRISIGGSEDQSVKIDKAKSLGEKVVSRL
jgi:hypothetical protein